MELTHRSTYPAPPAELSTRGTARLEIRGERVRVRRKGLALLYYLALEGPATRQKLAHMLWGHGQALQNLRVELHRLRDTLGPLGRALFTDALDPLSLAPGVLAVSAGVGEPLEGLDDISPDYQEWLERQRIKAGSVAPTSPRIDLVESLSHGIALPHVVILSGEPGSGRRSVARDLAGRLRLPFVVGTGGAAPSVNYIDLTDPGSEDLAAAVARGEERLWVLARSAFGTEPEVILRLRAAVVPERLRFVCLPPLQWWDAKPLFPTALGFTQRARYYLASLGNHRYLGELLKLAEAGQIAADRPLPVPLTVRASLALEARKLSPGARSALELVSTAAGELSTAALLAAGLGDKLPELEEGGWLRFTRTGWVFASELARRMVLELVPEGTRRLYQATLAQAATPAGSSVLASLGAGVSTEVGSRAPAVGERQVLVAGEVWLDSPVVSAAGARLIDDKVLFSRPGLPDDVSAATWGREREPLLYRVHGRTYSESGSVDLRYASKDIAITQAAEDKFDHWLLVPADHWLRVETRAEGSITELRVSAYRYSELTAAPVNAEWLVTAAVLHARPEASPLGEAAPGAVLGLATARATSGAG
ncbi:MAG: ATP-binding protein [Trueperaceae bacterium]|nr:ATP-binding protein [Trueperaceae bacterium]